MQNTVDTRSQQIQQRFDNKAKNNFADTTESQSKSPVLNRPATTQYLNIVSHEQEELGDVLSRSYNRLNQALSQAASSPDSQTVDEQAEKMGTYAKLAVKVINRDPHLQEQVAQDLSSGKKLVRSRNAADTLQTTLSNLPKPLKEGTNAGKHLAKFIVENLVSLTDTKNMGAGLERDLAVRQISVPKKPLAMRAQQAVSKVLSASIAYVQSNQPEIIASLKSDEPEVVKPGTTTAQVMTRYLRQALNEFPDDSTYLDIFKQNRSHQNPEGYADKMSEEIAQRIHNLISKAANTAKSGNLIQLSPEEAARFDQIQREAAGQGLNQSKTQINALSAQNIQGALSSVNNATGANTVDANVVKASNVAGQNASNADKAAARALSNAADPEQTNVRDLSLSELSARAAKLQQQFRQERQRLANDGKLPDPAPMPTKSFDNVKTARDILKGTLSPENFALTERHQQIKEQSARLQNNLNSALIASTVNAEAAKDQTSNAASKLVQTLSSTAEQKAQSINQTQSDVSAKNASQIQAKTTAKSTTQTQSSTNTQSSEANQTAATNKVTTSSQSSANTNGGKTPVDSSEPKSADSVLFSSTTRDSNSSQNSTAVKSTEGSLTSQLKQLQSEQVLTNQPTTNTKNSDISLAQGTLQAQRASFQMEFSAIQNNLYGDLDIMPGMTIPVSHFGEFSKDTLQPNQQALESLKYQARILEESLKQQNNVLSADNKTTTDKSTSLAATLAMDSDYTDASSATKSSAALATASELTELEKAVSTFQSETYVNSPRNQNQLQQFLQQAASLLQQHAKTTGEPLTMEQSQLQQFLQQAQSILQKLDPNLEQHAVLNQTAASTTLDLEKYVSKSSESQLKPSSILTKLNEDSIKSSDAQSKNNEVESSTKSQSLSFKPLSVSSEFVLPSKESLQGVLTQAQKSLDAQVKAQDGLIFPTQSRLKEQLENLQTALNKGGVSSENLDKLQQALNDQIKSQGEQITPVQSQLQKALTKAQEELEKLAQQQAEAESKVNPASKLLGGLSQETFSALQNVLNQSQNKLEQQAASQDGILFTTQTCLKEQLSALQNIFTAVDSKPALTSKSDASINQVSVSDILKDLQQALSEQIKTQGNQSTLLQTKLMQLVDQAQNELKNASASTVSLKPDAQYPLSTPSQQTIESQQVTNDTKIAKLALDQGTTTALRDQETPSKDVASQSQPFSTFNKTVPNSEVADIASSSIKTDAAKDSSNLSVALSSEVLNNLKGTLSEVQDNLSKIALSQDGQLFPSQRRLLEQLSFVQTTMVQVEKPTTSSNNQILVVFSRGLSDLQQALSEQIKAQGNQSLPVQAQLQKALEQTLLQLGNVAETHEFNSKPTVATQDFTAQAAANASNVQSGSTSSVAALTTQSGAVSTVATSRAQNNIVSTVAATTESAKPVALDTERLMQALNQAQKNTLQQIKSQGDKAVAEQLNLIKSIEGSKAGVEQKVDPASLASLLNQTQNALSAVTKLQGNLQTPAQAQLQQVIVQSLASIPEGAEQNQAAVINSIESKQQDSQTVQNSTTAQTTVQNSKAVQGTVSQGIFSMLQSFNNDMVQTQDALKVLQEAPSLQQKQVAFDSIQKLLTSAHNKITSSSLKALPNLPQLQQLVGFSELAVINIARANTPERTMQAIQQLNLCLTQAQREVKGTLELVAQIQNQNAPAQSTVQNQSTASIADEVGITVQTPSKVKHLPNNQSASTIASNVSREGEEGITTEEAELAAKFNQLRPAFDANQSPQQTANAHIQGAANLGAALHTDYALAPQNTPASVFQHKTLTERFSAQGMDWLANSANAAGMSTEQYAKALAQAQSIAEQYRDQTIPSDKSPQSNHIESSNSAINNACYTKLFSRLYGQIGTSSIPVHGSTEQGVINTIAGTGTTSSTISSSANGTSQANGSNNAPTLNQSIVALGVEETETPEGVSKENSVFSTRASLSAGKERLEAQQERRDANNSAQQVKVQHAEIKELKESSLEQHQSRLENLNQQQQQIAQQQQRTDTVAKQEQLEQALRHQQVASFQSKLNIASDPELVDQQFARLYQQQRADQIQQQQTQAAQIVHQLKAGGTSITASNAQVLAQSAVLGDSQQQNQALGIHGTDGASRAAAEAQAQALAQGTHTIGRTAVTVDDRLTAQQGRPQATIGNTAVEARNPITAGHAINQATINQATGLNQTAGQMPSGMQQGQGSIQQGLVQGTVQPNQGATYQGQSVQSNQTETSNAQANLSNSPNALTAKTTGGLSAVQAAGAIAGISGLPTSGIANTSSVNTAETANKTLAANVNGLVPTGDGRNALSVASLNKSMPFGATIPNSSTQLTIHLDDVNLDDPIVKNMGSTVPAQEGALNREEDSLNSNALSGVVADTEFARELNESAKNVGVAGAAAITSGENAPIPNESVVPNIATPRESGLLQRLASLFAGKTHDDLGEEVEHQGKTAKDLSASPEILRSLQEQAMQSQLKQSSLDNLIQRLQSSVADQNLPPQIREQANKLMKALENPVADLHSVSSWLNFVTGPMSPSSSQALAMHQWAFMLLCIRFEQIGKNVEKFLKKRMSGEDLVDLEPSLDKAHTDSGIFNDLVDNPQEKAQELLDDTFSQVRRLQQQMEMLPVGQLLPRNIPLPPFYRGGKEGSLHAQQQTDETGGKSWHLNFNLDLEKLGPMQVKVKLRFPDIQMSFVTSNLEALQAVQAHMPELNARLKEIGLTSKGSSVRLGRLNSTVVTSSEVQDNEIASHTRSTYGDNEFNAKA